TFYLPRWGRWITTTSGRLLAASARVGVILFIMRRRPGGRLYRWHLRLGVFFAPLVFIIALNGVVVTYRFVVFPLIFLATGSPIPKDMIKPPEVEAPAGAERIGLDQAIRIAEEAVPEADNGVMLEPVRYDRPIVVLRRKPHEPRDVGGTFVQIHPYSGEVMSITDFTDGPMGYQLVYATEHLHKGEWGGYFGRDFKIYSRILWIFAALSVPVLVILGGLSFRPSLVSRGAG
ncbi:MAG: PepSY-associated TM helix domain-containing protein, partial [Verrucomicrobiota bacterium]